jgi:hypothetical protein
MPGLNCLRRSFFGAVLTALALMSAGGFSFADAVLDHGNSVPTPAELRHHGVHIEPPGRGNAHSDQCLLGSALCGPRVFEQPRTALLSFVPAILQCRLTPYQTLSPSTKQFVIQPRAPPRHFP